eukprot:7129097-Pyramimonas_sp.AAC.1
MMFKTVNTTRMEVGLRASYVPCMYWGVEEHPCRFWYRRTHKPKYAYTRDVAHPGRCHRDV